MLRSTSVEEGTGGVAVNGFLLDMPKLFEDFVTVALREALETARGGRSTTRIDIVSAAAPHRESHSCSPLV